MKFLLCILGGDLQLVQVIFDVVVLVGVIVYVVDFGVKVINVFMIICLFVDWMVDQVVLGVVIWYVVVDKDVVIVVVVGNIGVSGLVSVLCDFNLLIDLSCLDDLWNWVGVILVFILLWWQFYVLLVVLFIFVGQLLKFSMFGLWVGIVVFGENIVLVSNLGDGVLVNGLFDVYQKLVVFSGISYVVGYVFGMVVLVCSCYFGLNVIEVVCWLIVIVYCGV